MNIKNGNNFVSFIQNCLHLVANRWLVFLAFAPGETLVKEGENM
jgi:hypothetical protein